ncbi:MAG: undecaprenyl-diphosphatase, partial [Patulibacter sp.]|nr:undecaprenyl-diphosphatase [Patulibacter sp.]
LLVADKMGKHEREVEDITIRDGIIIGFAQALALIPGVSRSGATMTAGMALGFDRAAAARYSFLLSVPAVVMSGLFELRKIGDGSLPVGGTIVGTIAAFIVGYASIAWMLKWLTSHTVAVFTGYRVILGVAVLVLVSAGAIS